MPIILLAKYTDAAATIDGLNCSISNDMHDNSLKYFDNVCVLESDLDAFEYLKVTIVNKQIKLKLNDYKVNNKPS